MNCRKRLKPSVIVNDAGITAVKHVMREERSEQKPA